MNSECDEDLSASVILNFAVRLPLGLAMGAGDKMKQRILGGETVEVAVFRSCCVAQQRCV